MLELHQVEIDRDDWKLAANISLPTGQIYGLMGASGAGKSSLLLALAGLIPTPKGRMIWNQQDLNPIPPAKRPIASLFQSHNLFAHLTINQNIDIAIRKVIPDRDERNQRIRDVLAKLDIGSLGDRLPRDVSGGQAARAALARAVLQNRPILLLDEVFAGLGPALGQELRQWLRENFMAHDRIIILSSHQIHDVKDQLDAILWIDQQYVSSPQNIGEFMANPPKNAQKYLGFTPTEGKPWQKQNSF